MTRAATEILRTTDGGLRPVDFREAEPYRDMGLLAIGGTGGSGVAFVERFLRGGGRVTAVTHRGEVNNVDPTSFNALRGQLVEMYGLSEDIVNDPRRLSLTYAHIERPEEVDAMIKRERREGKRFEHIMMFPAEGIPHGREFAGYLDRMLAVNKSRDADEVKDEKLKTIKFELNTKFDIWLPESRPAALAVNVEGPKEAIKIIADLNGPFSLHDLNSNMGFTGIGGHFYGGPCPEEAHGHTKEERQRLNGVLLKHLKTLEYDEHGEELAAMGILINEYVAPAIFPGTAVGGIIVRKIVPLAPEPMARQIMDTKIEREDVGIAADYVMRMNSDDRANGPHPLRIFLLRQNNQLVLAHEMPADLIPNVLGLGF